MKIIKQDSGILIIKDSWILALGSAVFALGLFYFIFNKYGASNISVADYKLYSKYLPFIFLITFILLLAIYSELEIKFDKSVNQIKIIKKKIWGSKKTQEFQFSDIEKIVLKEDIKTNNSHKGRGQSIYYPLYLYLKDGEIGSEILISKKSSGIFNSLSKNREFGKTIAEFIDVPFSEVRAPSISEAL